MRVVIIESSDARTSKDDLVIPISMGCCLPKPEQQSAEQLFEYSEIEETIASGDLAVLYRKGQKTPNFAVFIQHPQDDPDFPLLLLKGRTKPLPKEKTLARREAHTTTAVNRIFYGDYERVLVRHLESRACSEVPINKMMELAEEVQKSTFSDDEQDAIANAESDEARSALVGAFMVAQFYSHLSKSVSTTDRPIFEGDPSRVSPHMLQQCLKLREAKSLKLPPLKPGPLVSGDPPLLHQLLKSQMDPPSGITPVPYDDIASTLNTGDIMLLSGVTNSGAVIKLFDGGQFSHVAIVIRSKYTTELMAWESNTNKTGLVDVRSGKVTQGVELLPIRYQLYSGWNNYAAFRRLTGISDEQREKMYKELLRFRKEVQGRPYEKNKFEMICSSFDGKYLSFLENEEEDLSSLFCSELVAEAYKRMGILDATKLSSEFTPDDFSSARDYKLKLKLGKLEPEEYVELKLPQP